MEHPEFNIIGIETRTTNENDQAATDIGALWKSFLEDQILDKIPNKEDILCQGVVKTTKSPVRTSLKSHQ